MHLYIYVGLSVVLTSPTSYVRGSWLKDHLWSAVGDFLSTVLLLAAAGDEDDDDDVIT